MTIRTLFGVLFLLPLSPLQTVDGHEKSECRALKLSERKVSDNRVYRLNDTVSFSIGYDSGLDTQNDYGTRLMLLKQSGGVFSRVYHSSGSSDSYGMRPTFVANCGGNEVLVFGEMGTEYSWGLRVFSYNDGGIQNVGTIPLAVEGELDAASVVPFMKLSQEGHFAIVSFTKDLIRDPGSPNEKAVSKRSIRYRVDHNKLTEILP